MQDTGDVPGFGFYKIVTRLFFLPLICKTVQSELGGKSMLGRAMISATQIRTGKALPKCRQDNLVVNTSSYIGLLILLLGFQFTSQQVSPWKQLFLMFSINFYLFLHTALISSKYIFSLHDVYIVHILRGCYHIPFNHPLAKLYIFSSFHLSHVLPSNSVGSSLNSS